MEYSSILSYIREEVENGARVMFSSDIKVDQEKLLNLIDDLSQVLPRELEEAQGILNQRDAIINDAQAQFERITEQARADADRMIQHANEESERLVQETEVARKANAYAQATVEQAQNAADEIRRSGNEYVGDILADLETYISKQLEMVRTNRSQMRGY
ncbi:MAG: hypothetical protein ACOX17_07880 [Christensenellales bacterium]|jgi:vacuolar-type H+-ATPase subunit H